VNFNGGRGDPRRVDGASVTVEVLVKVPALDGRILFFAVLITVGTGIAFGIVPAVRTGGYTVAELHQGGRAGVGGHRERLRTALVLTEIACSVVLLVGFGVLAHALLSVRSFDPGFRSDHVLTLRTSLPMPSRCAPTSYLA